jgi:hypothetical protein
MLHAGSVSLDLSLHTSTSDPTRKDGGFRYNGQVELILSGLGPGQGPAQIYIETSGLPQVNVGCT